MGMGVYSVCVVVSAAISQASQLATSGGRFWHRFAGARCACGGVAAVASVDHRRHGPEAVLGRH